MPRWNAAGVLGGFGGRWSTARDELWRLAVRAEAQGVGFLLAPFNPCFFAVDAQAEIVFVADRDLAGPEHTAGIALVAHYHLHVVIEAAVGHGDGGFGGDLFSVKSADKAGEIVGVRANVTQRSGGTTLSGIGPPGGLFLAGGFHRGRQPVLRVFDLH